MSSNTKLLKETVPERHIVQLYGEDDRPLKKSVGRYLEEGLKQGDGLVVIASIEHIGPFARPLKQQGGYQEAVRQGRLVFLDAQATLAQFMIDGQPDWPRFERTVGGALREVQRRAGHRRIRAYGEMVGLLWKAGQCAAAIRVEEYWSILLAATSCSLFCAYPIDVLGREFQRATVEPLLCAHTHFLSASEDLERAVERAIDEVLGPRRKELGPLMIDDQPAWAVMPKAEAAVLWLRDNLPDDASEILRRARRYSRERSAERPLAAKPSI